MLPRAAFSDDGWDDGNYPTEVTVHNLGGVVMTNLLNPARSFAEQCAEVDVLLALSGELEMLCNNCGRAESEHSFHGNACPWPWPIKLQTTFTPARCEAAYDPRDLHTSACGEKCIPGSLYCAEHHIEF